MPYHMYPVLLFMPMKIPLLVSAIFTTLYALDERLNCVDVFIFIQNAIEMFCVVNVILGKVAYCDVVYANCNDPYD